MAERIEPKTIRNKNLRESWLARLAEFLTQDGQEPHRTNGNSIGFYTLDEAGEESAVRITIQVPKGSREGDEYDPVGEAEDYATKQAEKHAKDEKRAAEKAAKIKQDEERRARAKAAKEEKKNKGVGEV